MKTKKIHYIFAILATSALLFSCSKKKEEVVVDELIKVTTTVAQTQSIPLSATFTANVEGETVNQITPAIPMRIKKIYVDVGANVSKGQKLVEMDNSNLDQQKLQLNNLEKDYLRYEELLKVGGISQQQMDQLKVQLDVTRTAINNLKENTILTSPINGTVTARNYDNGDVFAQRPILTVQQLNPVKILINVSESYFPKVKPGMPVDVKLDIYENEVFQGKVKLIHPTIDPGTHTFVCEITINNPKLLVRPGMFARVTLNFGTSNSILIPDLAVQKQSGSNDKYVFVINDNIAKYKKVELGQRLDDKCEILSGINEGDVIVTTGQTRLIDGTKVEIIQN